MRESFLVVTLAVAAFTTAATGQEAPAFRSPTIAVEVSLWSDHIDLSDAERGPQGEYLSHARPSKRQSRSPLNQIKAVVEQALLVNPIRRQQGSPLGTARDPDYTLRLDLEQEGASALGPLRMTLQLVSDQVDVTFDDRIILDLDSDHDGSDRTGEEILLSIQDGDGDLLADYVCQFLQREWLDRTRLLLGIWEQVILADQVLLTRSPTEPDGFLCALPFTYHDLWVTWPASFRVSVKLDRTFRYRFDNDDAEITYQGTAVPAFAGGILAFPDSAQERDVVFQALARLAATGDALLRKGTEVDLGEGRSASVRGVEVGFQPEADGGNALRWNTRRRPTPPSEVGTG